MKAHRVNPPETYYIWPKSDERFEPHVENKRRFFSTLTFERDFFSRCQP